MKKKMSSGTLIALNGWTAHGSFVNGSDRWRAIDMHQTPSKKGCIGLYVGPEVCLQNWRDMNYIGTYEDKTKSFGGGDWQALMQDGTKINITGAIFKLLNEDA